MAQHSTVHMSAIRYSRTDFTALRALVQRVPAAKVADLYYSEDAPQVLMGMEKFLSRMRMDLVERAIFANPHLADALARARAGGTITPTILDILVKAADAKPSAPSPSDHIGQWLRAKVARQLAAEGIQTLHDLKSHIEAHGAHWWTPIPRIGSLRAQAITAWLNRHEQLAINPATQALVLDAQIHTPLAQTPLPLERIGALPSDLDGHNGINRGAVFSYLSAKNDLQALRAYIQKFRNQPHTARAYQREVERFLLWCVILCRKPLSSVLVDDCEAYKAFLESPSPAFCGPRRGRLTPQWKPFTGPLSPESQKQAVQILRTAMGWLHKVRYLGGNPWAAVADPLVEQQLNTIQIERALPSDLYEQVVANLSEQAAQAGNTQARITLCALLLMGDCGLRISEVAGARAEKLEPSPFVPGQFKLTILGKGKKLRSVPLSQRAAKAIQSHQHDQELQYGQRPAQGAALIRPLTLPPIEATGALHQTEWRGYAPNSLARIIKKALKAIAGRDDVAVDDMLKLNLTTAHGLRHTFGTQAVEREMPLDVIQSILGHSSIDTTSIYIRAQEKRVAQEADKFHGKAP